MRLTVKQINLLTVIAKGNADGTFLDLDQVLEALPYKTTKQSLQFSIRSLIAREVIKKGVSENRRERQRTILEPTPLGLHYTASARGPAMVVSESEDDLDREFLS